MPNRDAASDTGKQLYETVSGRELEAIQTRTATRLTGDFESGLVSGSALLQATRAGHVASPQDGSGAMRCKWESVSAKLPTCRNKGSFKMSMRWAASSL